MEVLTKCLMSLWLFLCGWQDFKEKKISLGLLAAGGVILTVIFALTGEVTITGRLLGLAQGLLLMFLSKLLKGKIGLGDGIIISITGICLGFQANLGLLIYSLTLAAIVSVIMLALKKAGKTDTIPFIPFLFLSYLGGLFFV